VPSSTKRSPHLLRGVVAEQDGRLVGSNFLTMGDQIGGIGPVTVSPAVQGSGVGTISLYAALGFQVREPLLALVGTLRESTPRDQLVRPLGPEDIPACEELCIRVHGSGRTSDVRKASEPFVVTRGGRLTGYLTSATRWQASHGVAESEHDMQALLAGSSAATGRPVALLLPTRQASLFRWCLVNGLKGHRAMTLMSMGAHNHPSGTWFPSLYS
jgi:hypothetical protein